MNLLAMIAHGDPWVIMAVAVGPDRSFIGPGVHILCRQRLAMEGHGAISEIMASEWHFSGDNRRSACLDRLHWTWSPMNLLAMIAHGEPWAIMAVTWACQILH